jgi:hypothetical protein
MADGNSPSAYRLQEKLEFPWSPLALSHGKEFPVIFGSEIDASLGETQMGRDDENHY